MKHLGLFEGIGGFSLAARWAGLETVAWVEINEFGQKVLRHHFPGAKGFNDIKQFGLEQLWKDYAQSVKNQYVPQEGRTVNHAIQSAKEFGEKPIEKGPVKIPENGTEGERLKSSIITEEDVFVVENLKLNFSVLTINTIMEMQKEGIINHRLGSSLSNAAILMTTKSSVTTAITQKHFTEFAHTINKIKPDVITAGVPCQPASTAGKRKGKEDDRWLWGEAFRVLREFQPTWAIFENVRGLLSLERGVVFDSLLADLEAEGYEVLPFLLPACAVNAPHRRDRIWIVARRDNKRGEAQSGERGFGESCPGDSERVGREEGIDSNGSIAGLEGLTIGQEGGVFITTSGNVGATPDTERGRSSGQEHGQTESGLPTETHPGSGWTNFPTQPPVRFRNDGLSFELDGITFPRWRNETIKAYGNAIVPQVAYQIFKAINEYENR